MDFTGVTAEYTRDPRRIRILKQNAMAGEMRERLDPSARDLLDRQCMTVTPAHIRNLRSALGMPIKSSQ